MNKEEMISEIERYLSHVIAKDFPLPKAIRLMYEEYKNSNKNWEKIYDEDQNYIGELNNKIFDLEVENKELKMEINTLKESQLVLYGDDGNIVGCIRLGNDVISKHKIKEKIEEITSYAYTSAEERDCQDYAIQVLKELLEE